jgi:hypothetical protein
MHNEKCWIETNQICFSKSLQIFEISEFSLNMKKSEIKYSL